jgi:membrane-bound metal-dependent hydrolase YbcI (DUF457 family)
MSSPTHLAFSQLMFLLLVGSGQVPLTPVNVLLTATGAALPDLDSTSTYPGKTLPFIAARIERRFGHRTITHSLALAAGISIVLLPLAFLNTGPYLCLIVGYMSHLLLDTMTVTGVCLLYPFSPRRCVFPMDVYHPHSYRVETGARTDRALGAILALACIPAFLVAREGFDRFLRTAQKDIESAVRDYTEFSRHSRVFAWIEGYNMFAGERLSGEYEVLGALNEQTLVIEGPGGRIVSVGKEHHATYVAEDILCHEGPPVMTTVRSIDMSNQPLSQINAYVDTAADNHLFGTVWLDAPVSIALLPGEFSPVSGTSGEVRLAYARLRDLEPFRGSWVTRGNVTVRTLVPTGGASSPATPATYVRVEFLSGDSLVILKRRGDTVAAGEVLIVAAGGSRERLRLIRERIDAVEREEELKREELQVRIDRETEILRKDSLELVHTRRLALEGFAHSSTNARLANALTLTFARLRTLRSSAKSIAGRARIEKLRLSAELEETEERLARTRRSRQAVAPAAGVIDDIRQERKGAGILYLITIRRKP